MVKLSPGLTYPPFITPNWIGLRRSEAAPSTLKMIGRGTSERPEHLNAPFFNEHLMDLCFGFHVRSFPY